VLQRGSGMALTLTARAVLCCACASFAFVASVACSSGTRTPFAEDPPPAQPNDADADAATLPPPPEEAGVDPPPPDDCERTPPSLVCGLAPQCGCSASETCDLADLEGVVRCVPAGKAPMGHPCTSTVGCARGLSCVFGTCRPFCDKAGSACAEDGAGQCIQVQSQGSPVPNFKVCRVSCDLRDADGCGGTTRAGTGVCVVDVDGATDCVGGGTRAQGEPCTPSDDCGPSLVCVTTGGAETGACRRWCRVGQPDCGANTQCNGFQNAVVVDGVEHGACPLP
jgi:hypothetical protein